jgi:hypothetical protein
MIVSVTLKFKRLVAAGLSRVSDETCAELNGVSECRAGFGGQSLRLQIISIR